MKWIKVKQTTIDGRIFMSEVLLKPSLSTAGREAAENSGLPVKYYSIFFQKSQKMDLSI